MFEAVGPSDHGKRIGRALLRTTCCLDTPSCKVLAVSVSGGGFQSSHPAEKIVFWAFLMNVESSLFCTDGV